MSLIKKTIVLSKDVARGYITFIRLGKTVGAKLILSPYPTSSDNFWIALKVGDSEQFMARVDSERMEFDLPNISFSASDIIGVVILDDKGIYAQGGQKDIVNIPLLKEEMKKAVSLEDTPIQIEDSETEAFASQVVESEENATPSTLEEKPKAEDTRPKKESNAEEIPLSPVDEPKVEEVSRDQAPTERDNKSADSREIRKGINNDTEKEEEVLEDAEEVEIEIEVPKDRNPFNMPKDENFYKSIRSKLEDIMTINPRMPELEKIIPDSKWVRVRYDAEDYYVVGVLTEDGVITHIAYGVPGYPHIKPPKEAQDLCDFLPLTPSSGRGYWLMFQDAKSGEIIKN